MYIRVYTAQTTSSCCSQRREVQGRVLILFKPKVQGCPIQVAGHCLSLKQISGSKAETELSPNSGKHQVQAWCYHSCSQMGFTE